jgi:plastocyanin
MKIIGSVQGKLAFVSSMISIGYIVLIVGCTNATVFAEQKITIIPDAHSNTAVRFLDVTDYFIPVGEELTWFNDDFVDYKLILTDENNTTRLAEFDLASNGSFSYVFEEPGKYYYSSIEYPKIQGLVRVIDPIDVSTVTKTGLKNGIDVQVSWTPSQIGSSLPEQGTTDFLITFIDNKTGANQEHIDYRYSINDESENEVFSQGLHSTYGVEVAKYNFDKPGKFSPQVKITHVLFAPVDPDLAEFDKAILSN